MIRLGKLLAVIVLALAVGLFSLSMIEANAANNGNSGANKWQVQSRDNLLIGFGEGQGKIFRPVDIRTSNTGDLVIEVQSECAVGIFDLDFLQAANFDPDIDLDFARGVIKVRVKVDGEVLDPGWVNFCSRTVGEITGLFQQFCSAFGASSCVNLFDASIDIFSTAAGFTWFATDVGHGVHTVTVEAKGSSATIDLGGFVFGAVGSRNLTILTTTTLQAD